MFIFAIMPEPVPEAALPTRPLRAHLTHLRQAIIAAERLLRTLHTLPPAQVGERLYEADRFLYDGLAEHLLMEERVLYPVVDSFREAGQLPLTAPFRDEATRICALAEEIHRVRQEPSMDAGRLRTMLLEALRRARAHFDEEEAVLLPFLDARLTAEEVRARIADPLLDHGYGTGPTDHHAASHHMQKFHHNDPHVPDDETGER